MILYVFGGLIWSNRKIKELKKNDYLASLGIQNLVFQWVL
jgi:hypothetical protein